MDPNPDRIAETLRRHPSPALPLSSLVGLVAGEGPAPIHPDPHALLHAVRSRPDLFRIVEWGGRERSAGRAREREGNPLRPLSEPWVVVRGARSRHEDPERGPRPVRAVLDETLRHLSLRVDDGSFVALCRWLRLVHEAIRLSSRSGRARSTTPPPDPPPRARDP